MLVVEKQFDPYLFLDQTRSNHVPLFCKISTHYTVTITILIPPEYFFPEILANEKITSRNGNHLKIFPPSFPHPNPSLLAQNLSKILNTSVLLSNFPPLWTIVPFDSDRARRSLLINDISKYISNLFIDPTREIVCAWWVKHHREEGGGQQFINSPCARRKFARHPVLKVAPCESCEAKES